MKGLVLGLLAAALGCSATPEPTPIDLANSISWSEKSPDFCQMLFELEPPELQQIEGYIVRSLRQNHECDGCCGPIPTWRVDEEVNDVRGWKVYRRITDVVNDNPDPDNMGNYVKITTPGKHWVETFYPNALNPDGEGYGAIAVLVQ